MLSGEQLVLVALHPVRFRIVLDPLIQQRLHKWSRCSAQIAGGIEIPVRRTDQYRFNGVLRQLRLCKGALQQGEIGEKPVCVMRLYVPYGLLVRFTQHHGGGSHNNLLQLLVQHVDRLVQHIAVQVDGVALHSPRSNRVGPQAGNRDAKDRQCSKRQPYSFLQRGPVKPGLQHGYTSFIDRPPGESLR